MCVCVCVCACACACVYVFVRVLTSIISMSLVTSATLSSTFSVKTISIDSQLETCVLVNIMHTCSHMLDTCY